MLYVFHGSDTHKVADQTNKLVAGLRAKRPDALVYTFAGPVEEVAELDGLVEAQGLFVQKHVVVLKTPFESAESRDLVLERVERFAASDNIFVLAEGKLLAAHKRALEKHATKIEEHVAVQQAVKKFNVFALGDALGSRNRRTLWLGYIEARRAGLEPEAICGSLHWAVRNMLNASRAKSADEAGLKQFPYDKAKRAAAQYTSEELRALSHSLIAAYHDAHRGKHNLDTALERWTLSV